MVAYYCGSLVYANLSKEQQDTKRYEEGLTQMAAKKIWKWANELPEKKIDKHAIEHKVRIVPAPFRATQYINDKRYLPGDTTLKSETLNRLGENTVQFLQSRSPPSHTDFSTFKICSV